ncbi:MAG: hypothetical protein ACPGYV_15445 [Phycisphaeraceae bacterium]
MSTNKDNASRLSAQDEAFIERMRLSYARFARAIEGLNQGVARLDKGLNLYQSMRK